MNSKIKLRDGDSFVEYSQQLNPDLRLDTSQFEELWNLHPEDKGKIKIFGKEIETPRYFQNYGNNYDFSGMKHPSIDTPSILQPFLDWINSQDDIEYNGILVNWYLDGSHYIGFHSDDEKSLIKNSSIYCFSFGQERNFVVKSKRDKDDKKKFKLANNSLIKMGGECQTYYKHSIPKITGSKSDKIKRRISVTIRAFK